MRRPRLGASREPSETWTLWECFEFVEAIEPREELRMKAYDLGFDPLQHRPKPGQAWPAFVISAQATVPIHPRQVSQPPPYCLPPPKSQDHSPTFLYDAFENWFERAKDAMDVDS